MVVTSSVTNDAFLSARRILLSGEERLCTERPNMLFRSAAADPRRRRDERSDRVMVSWLLVVGLYQIMSFFPSVGSASVRISSASQPLRTY